MSNLNLQSPSIFFLTACKGNPPEVPFPTEEKAGQSLPERECKTIKEFFMEKDNKSPLIQKIRSQLVTARRIYDVEMGQERARGGSGRAWIDLIQELDEVLTELNTEDTLRDRAEARE